MLNPNKPDKLRVVFDCPAKHNGLSLNAMLYSSPNITTSLSEVMPSFRNQRVVIVSDSEEMIMQFNIPPRDRESLRFL